MKKAILIFFIICGLFLTGCQELNGIIFTQPNIKTITVSPEPVSLGESFKVFVTIKNPTNIEFKPYIMINYDKTVFQYQQYYYETKKIALEPIPSNNEKSYLLQFSVQNNGKAGASPITIFLYGEEGAIKSLNYQTKQVNVASSVR